MKQCTKCLHTKPFSEFRRTQRSRDGYQWYCKQCASDNIRRDYAHKYSKKAQQRSYDRQQKHQIVVNNYKRSGCVVCGETELVCMDLHHVDPTQKDFTISARYNRSIDVIVAELKKCVVVCSNCHRKIHAGVVKLGSCQSG